MPGEASGRRSGQARRGRSPRATAADVAALAGTSVATVSLVANGKTKGRVGPETITRVNEAIESLAYVVDHAASALARGSADIVILIAPDLANPYYGDVIRGVTEVLGERFQLLLAVAGTGVQPSPAVMRRLIGLRPAGLLVDAPSPDFVAALPSGPATVLLDAPGATASAPGAVNYDLAPGVDALIDHLADQGHRGVAYLDSSTGTDTFALRRSLVEAATVRRGLRFVGGASSLVEVGDATAAASAAWQRWRGAGAEAVVCATDTQAYGVLASARAHALRVPADVGVAGFDDLPSSALTAPGLTSVALPGAALGRTAAAGLLRALGEDPSEGTTFEGDTGTAHDTPPAHDAVPPLDAGPEHDAVPAHDLTARLVVRESTLRPKP